MARIVKSTAAAVVVGAVFIATASSAAAAGRGVRAFGVLVRTHPHALLPLHGGTVDSLNWSGYAVTPRGGGITAVAATFRVPAAGVAPPGFAATWAGIGGYNTRDLIQAGTAEQSSPGNPVAGPQYYAWYELLPGASIQLTGCSGDAACTVNPGDAISVAISQVDTSTWSMSMVDAGHWSWSKTVGYRSSRSSAEWVLEAPTLVAQTLMAPVGTVSFGPTSTFTAGGVTDTIAAGDPIEIVLSPGAVNEATPSALGADGQSFNDCAYAQTCPTPASAQGASGSFSATAEHPGSSACGAQAAPRHLGHKLLVAYRHAQRLRRSSRLRIVGRVRFARCGSTRWAWARVAVPANGRRGTRSAVRSILFERRSGRRWVSLGAVRVCDRRQVPRSVTRGWRVSCR